MHDPSWTSGLPDMHVRSSLDVSRIFMTVGAQQELNNHKSLGVSDKMDDAVLRGVVSARGSDS